MDKTTETGDRAYYPTPSNVTHNPSCKTRDFANPILLTTQSLLSPIRHPPPRRLIRAASEHTEPRQRTSASSLGRVNRGRVTTTRLHYRNAGRGTLTSQRLVLPLDRRAAAAAVAVVARRANGRRTSLLRLLLLLLLELALVEEVGDARVDVVVGAVQVEGLAAGAAAAAVGGGGRGGGGRVLLETGRGREGRVHGVDVEAVPGPGARRVQEERLLEHAAAAAHRALRGGGASARVQRGFSGEAGMTRG